MTYSYICFVLFAFAAYLILTDQSVARAFLLVLGILRFQYEKLKWWVVHNPRMPWVQFIIYRRSMKLAKELMKEMQE